MNIVQCTCKHGQATCVTKATSCRLAITNLHTYAPSDGSGDTYATTFLSQKKRRECINSIMVTASRGGMDYLHSLPIV